MELILVYELGRAFQASRARIISARLCFGKCSFFAFSGKQFWAKPAFFNFGKSSLANNEIKYILVNNFFMYFLAE